MVTIEGDFVGKISDDDDKGYGSDESLSKVVHGNESTFHGSLQFDSTQSHDKEIAGDEDVKVGGEDVKVGGVDVGDVKPHIDGAALTCHPEIKEGIEDNSIGWEEKKVKKRFRRTVWKELLGVDCFKFRMTSIMKNQCDGDIDCHGETDGGACTKDSNEETDLQMESRKPNFGVDYENIELGQKLNRKLRPANSGKFPKIRLHLKPKLSIWEMGKTVRKRLQVCLRSAEKRKKRKKDDAEVQCGPVNSTCGGKTNNSVNNGSHENSNIINFVVDAQTISGELPVDLASMLIDLQSRDLTPEDYEMLLLLDDSLQKKFLDKSAVDKLPVSSISLEDGPLMVADSSHEISPKNFLTNVDEKNLDTAHSITHDDNQNVFSASHHGALENASTTTTTTTTTTRATAHITNLYATKSTSYMLESINVEEVTKVHSPSSTRPNLIQDISRTCQSASNQKPESHPSTPELPLPDLIPKTSNKQILDLVCTICQEHFEVGQQKLTLPCSHFFHLQCGIKWLTESSKNCPLDGLEVCLDR